MWMITSESKEVIDRHRLARCVHVLGLIIRNDAHFGKVEQDANKLGLLKQQIDLAQ